MHFSVNDREFLLQVPALRSTASGIWHCTFCFEINAIEKLPCGMWRGRFRGMDESTTADGFQLGSSAARIAVQNLSKLTHLTKSHPDIQINVCDRLLATVQDASPTAIASKFTE